ncbi:MAG: thymidine kinase [Termitinemataceae bacterium]
MSGSIEGEAADFLKSLGFPALVFHEALEHFDFKIPSRRILVIGPMGSGKTEYSARLWRDGEVARKKSAKVAEVTTFQDAQKHLFIGEPGLGNADRRNIFFVRSMLDMGRFPEYPQDALAYRGGYERCGERIAFIHDSFDLEELIKKHPQIGTWIIDEAAFYDERIAYLMKNESEKRGLVFVCPTLILNFRREIFNATARLLVEHATDVYPLTAYCEHPDCIEDSFYTYRYYNVEGTECPALYFDPLIIVGGDRKKDDPREPNYCTRCDKHHFLPGKEYTYFTLKPLGEAAARGQIEKLEKELYKIKYELEKSELYASFVQRYVHQETAIPENMNSLLVPCIPERALCYLYAEQNLLSTDQLVYLVEKLNLDREYLSRRLSDNRRPLDLLK